MTKPIGGEVIEPYANPELLAPGTVVRPSWIDATTWARMPWPAKWKAARRADRQVRPEDVQEAAGGPYRGGPKASQPCGTYAAYQRHKRAGERPCRACGDANNARWREGRIRRGQAVKRTEFDPDLVARFVRDEVAWDELGLEERIVAARRMDDNGVPRSVIARRTHLNAANLRRAFARPQATPARVDENDCAAQDSRQAS